MRAKRATFLTARYPLKKSKSNIFFLAIFIHGDNAGQLEKYEAKLRFFTIFGVAIQKKCIRRFLLLLRLLFAKMPIQSVLLAPLFFQEKSFQKHTWQSFAQKSPENRVWQSIFGYCFFGRVATKKPRASPWRNLKFSFWMVFAKHHRAAQEKLHFIFIKYLKQNQISHRGQQQKYPLLKPWPRLALQRSWKVGCHK